MVRSALRTCSLTIAAIVLAGAGSVFASGPLTNYDSAVCWDTNNFPAVGGMRECLTDNGHYCKFISTENGVSGGCN